MWSDILIQLNILTIFIIETSYKIILYTKYITFSLKNDVSAGKMT